MSHDGDDLTWEGLSQGRVVVQVDDEEALRDFLEAMESITDICWAGGEERPTEYYPKDVDYPIVIECLNWNPGHICYSEYDTGVPYLEFLAHAGGENKNTEPDMAAFLSLLGGASHGD